MGWGHEAFSNQPSHPAAQPRTPAGPRAHRAVRGHPRKMLFGGCTEKSMLSALPHTGQLRQSSPHKVVTRGAALKPAGELCLVPDACPGTKHATGSAPAKRPWAGPVQGREKKRGLRQGGVFHRPESCVRLHCRKQQVAAKGWGIPLASPSPRCAAFQREPKVSPQPRLRARAVLLRLSQGKLIRFTALSPAVS